MSQPVLSLIGVSVREPVNGATAQATFTFSLDQPATSAVTFAYYAQDGSASLAAHDYQGLAGNVTILAGSLGGQLSIPIYADNIAEANETIQLVALAPFNATLAGGAAALVATGTILDASSTQPVGQGVAATQVMGPASASATLPTLSVHDVSVIEGDSGSTAVRFLITFDRPLTSAVSFSYYFQDGTASDGSDYHGQMATITIGAGQQSAYVGAVINGDTASEGDETFKLIVTHPDGAVLAHNAGALAATATIIDNDGHAPDAVAGVGGDAAVLTSGAIPSTDVDGNGQADIVWHNSNGLVSEWSFAGSQGEQLVRSVYDGSADPSWHIVDTFDFDGDGRTDLLWRNNNGQVAVWTGNADGSFTGGVVTSPVGGSWRIAGAGDLNGDGRGDLLWEDANGAVTVWSSNGTGFTENAYSHAAVGASWKVEGVADVNGDGLGDVVWRNDDGTVTTWIAKDGGFQEGVLNQAVPTNWHMAGLGDFTGDGLADILWRNDDGSVSLWQSTGTGFQGIYLGSATTDWHVAEVADVNADGRADLVWRNDNGAIATWTSTGNGFQSGMYDSGVDPSWSIVGHAFTS